ncbi:iron ABC transporter substrate-binding protein [Pseudorhodoplanes sinuspersici]|uniref:Iron ABC transporter substrate-binding protein n=1 Tax=Pseudorhodoplanes sinuspersici TaxID=1235591 RepID=A0A1W6ZMY5_9HYPH|nr:iron ABC transporter substrate-binding protein [Pseudorhodoplanes sinuspersici]ARP98144.1 iron ABC transporter substrate-binding protein [Pseudorhodoplanes sinuspersici]RKE68103.1 iron complex transport system substrate-binding protein [Pseudorhodoplanes sinuspersici]
MLSRRSVLAGLLSTLPRVAQAQSVTDATGRVLAIPANVTRVFPAGPPAAIMLYTLAPDLLIGWPRANRLEEREYLLPDIGSRPEIGRITGRGNTANLEMLLALKPDLILDIGSTSRTYVTLAERVQEQTGIPYALLDGRFEATAASYRKLGELTRHEMQGKEFASYTTRTLDTIMQRIANVAPDKRPRVYFARGPRGLETGLGGSINVETIELLARNVAGERKGGLATVSIEQVLVWNPDVIITIDRDFASNVKGDPAWKGGTAVQEGRVHLAPKLPFGWIDFPPSVNRLIGLWWLAKILYPERFPEDIRAIARDFYARFYHVTPTDAQMDAVLEGRG